ncbi:MAG: Fe-S cluster assembly protein SufD, partial [Armatimonadetes bacterium]|nr:Fe-S cluster assembly protein SufD [Armatimonadota bacterium]
MAELVLPTQISREALEFIIKRNGEPVWVRELRRKAWDVFEQTPMPTPKDEEWRRTDLKAFRLTEYSPISLPEYDGVLSLDVLPNELLGFLHPGSEEGNIACLLYTS